MNKQKIFPGMLRGRVLALARQVLGPSACCMVIRSMMVIGIDQTGWKPLYAGATWAEAAHNMLRGKSWI